MNILIFECLIGVENVEGQAWKKPWWACSMLACFNFLVRFFLFVMPPPVLLLQYLSGY